MRSNISRVFEHLATGKSLTSQQAWHKWSVTRLADVIHELRTRYGIEVRTETVRSGSTRYARYWFEGKSI